MNPVLQWLSSAAVASVVVAIVMGLFSKRKLSAEATDIITKAATGVVERLESENVRQGAQLAAQQAQVVEIQRVQRLQGEALAIHAAWDRQTVRVARDAGIELPDPPPLHPESNT